MRNSATRDGGLAVDAVAEAHLADLKTQDRYGVRCLRRRDLRVHWTGRITNVCEEFSS